MKSDTDVFMFGYFFFMAANHALTSPVGVALAETLQRRALGAEQQYFQQITMRVDERNVFVDAGLQVFFGTHRHHVLAAYAVMLLQHGLHGVQNGTDHLAEQFVLAREVVVYVPDAYADCSGDLAHGGLGIALPAELLAGGRQYAAAYVVFQHSHMK